MKLLLKNNLILFVLFSCLIIIGGITIYATSKQQLHLFFNGYVNKSINGLFVNLTYLGDGFFVVGAIIVLAFINFRMFLTTGIAYALSSGVVQVLKNFVFDSIVRPTHFFGALNPKIELILVDGIEMHGLNSFPSGHTTAAFSLFFTLALLVPNKWSKTILFVLAFFVGLSRVYLSQHFFEDIYAGSVIGTLFSVLACYIFYFSSFSGKFNRLDAPVLRLIFAEKK